MYKNYLPPRTQVIRSKVPAAKGMVYIPFAYAQQHSMQMTQVSDPSKADAEEEAYQKVYDAEQIRLKAA